MLVQLQCASLQSGKRPRLAIARCGPARAHTHARRQHKLNPTAAVPHVPHLHAGEHALFIRPRPAHIPTLTTRRREKWTLWTYPTRLSSQHRTRARIYTLRAWVGVGGYMAVGEKAKARWAYLRRDGGREWCESHRKPGFGCVSSCECKGGYGEADCLDPRTVVAFFSLGLVIGTDASLVVPVIGLPPASLPLSPLPPHN